ncbi:MAG: sigma-70 family RNA polymerase sigma factor [Chloroflexi bacterium]|nr:MAG: sigma-70 family RNA polymerase sigma factor [Chloroflexota bacterium]
MTALWGTGTLPLPVPFSGAKAGALDRTAARDVVAPADPVDLTRLVDRAKGGDSQAFGALYDRFQPEILRYLTHRTRDPEAAEDLTQQVFLKAWQAIPRFEQRGVPFKAWLYRMAHNQMVDHFRTRKPTTELGDFDLPDEADQESALLTGEMNEALQRALARLSEDHRQVLTLRFLMEKSAREIGEVMGRKEVTVRGLQMRALQALRREIDGMGGLP